MIKTRNLIKEALHKIDWISKLSGTNCNENYNIFTNVLKTIMDEISPLKKICISGKRRYIEPWMSRGLEISSRKKDSLYKKTLTSDSTEANIITYKNYRNLYNKTKHNMKIAYYTK